MSPRQAPQPVPATKNHDSTFAVAVVTAAAQAAGVAETKRSPLSGYREPIEYRTLPFEGVTTDRPGDGR